MCYRICVAFRGFPDGADLTGGSGVASRRMLKKLISRAGRGAGCGFLSDFGHSGSGSGAGEFLVGGIGEWADGSPTVRTLRGRGFPGSQPMAASG